MDDKGKLFCFVGNGDYENASAIIFPYLKMLKEMKRTPKKNIPILIARMPIDEPMRSQMSKIMLNFCDKGGIVLCFGAVAVSEEANGFTHMFYIHTEDADTNSPYAAMASGRNKRFWTRVQVGQDSHPSKVKAVVRKIRRVMQRC